MVDVGTVATSLSQPFNLGIRAVLYILQMQEAVALIALGATVTSCFQYITKGGLEPVLRILRNIL